MINYNYLQRLLHNILLGSKFSKKSVYEIEKIIFLKNNNIKNNKHIFITGMPRSGTTSLLNFLDKSEGLCSLKYKDMPFIMAPNIAKLFKKAKIKKTQRFHNDNIFFDLESPESFDEVFFSIYKNAEIHEELLNYISLILFSYGKFRYLSKNNNNFRRINLIKEIFPNSIFLLPIREPLQQAYSLYSQHLNFTELQKNNTFILKYMNFLGHNEFGLNHHYWFKPVKHKNLLNINYWLEQWCLYYEFILNNFSDKLYCHNIVYENFKKNNFLRSLGLYENINILSKDYFNISRKKIKIEYDEELYNKAMNIYNKYI